MALSATAVYKPSPWPQKRTPICCHNAAAHNYGNNIAYLETFGFNNVVEAELNRYITLVHDQIAILDAPSRCWVLDVRRNTGGNQHAIQGGDQPALLGMSALP
ncbi:MAG: hypothetical protein R3D55_07445 [Chloroflexota bacterium]